MRFSRHFRLNQNQAQLDFVDIDVLRDMRLFVDPYAIQIKENEFSEACADQVRTFFDEVLSSLRKGDINRAQELTAYLSEPRETFLGFSKGRPRGRGVGRFQADQILNALRRSGAFQTGFLKDLAEAELFIEGISRDKISDLTTNVIRGLLIEYTQNECALHGIQLDQEVASGPIWDASRRRWYQSHVPLPVIEGRQVILVPKYFVRWRLSLDSQEFYNHYMLNFLREEHLSANSSLVRVLKTTKERVVYKKDLREKYPFIKEDLASFARKHPDVLREYKNLKGASGALGNEDLDEGFDERHFAHALRETLSRIPAGMRDAGKYHSFCLGLLTFLFYPDLINPIKEYEFLERRKRVDLKFTNAAEGGFFKRMGDSPETRSSLVFFECKNYSAELGNPELDQIAGRFSPRRGKLGFILCRTLVDAPLMERRCKDTAQDHRGYIIVLTDQKISQLLRLVETSQRDQISGVLFREYEALIN